MSRRSTLGVMNMSWNQIEVVVASHSQHTKCGWLVHFKMADFTACEFYLNWKTKKIMQSCLLGFSGGSGGKEPTCNVEDLSPNPVLGKSPGGGHGNPLQYSCLENSMDRRAWQATVHGFKESDTTEWLSTAQHSLVFYLEDVEIMAQGGRQVCCGETSHSRMLAGLQHSPPAHHPSS